MKIAHGEKTKIAIKAKCSPQMICDISKGRRRPSPELARRLEAATGIKAEAWIWPREHKNPFIKAAPKKATQGV